MCGIIGGLWPGREPPESALQRGFAALAHRGPDGSRWLRAGPAAVGFCRLAIHGRGGHALQPFASEEDGLLAANATLHRPPPGLDAETLRSADTMGDCAWIPPTLDREGPDGFALLDGPAAVAFLEPGRERLTLWRDAYGQKPMFWMRHEGGIAFASELGALLTAFPASDLDPLGVRQLLRAGFTFGATTLARGVHRLCAGERLVFEDGEVRLDRLETPAVPEPTDDLSSALRGAVARRLTTGRATALALSGGLDSAAIATALVDLDRPVPAFTLGFSSARLDEGHAARTIARHLGLEHEVFVSDERFDERLEGLVNTTGEPLADASWMALDELVARIGDRTTVLLTGDGGDEALAGYRRHRVVGLQHRTPRSLRPLVARAGGLVGGRRGQALRSWDLSPAHLLADLTGLTPRRESPFPIVRETDDPLAQGPWSPAASADEAVRQAAEIDHRIYLADDLCTKADRAGMRHGKELWSPWLDPAVQQACRAQPPSALIERGHGQAPLIERGLGKAPLRRILAKRLPGSIVNARKKGFGIPLLASWQEGRLGALGARVFAELGDELDRQTGTSMKPLLDRLRQGEDRLAPPLHGALVLGLWMRRWL